MNYLIIMFMYAYMYIYIYIYTSCRIKSRVSQTKKQRQVSKRLCTPVSCHCYTYFFWNQSTCKHVFRIQKNKDTCPKGCVPQYLVIVTRIFFRIKSRVSQTKKQVSKRLCTPVCCHCYTYFFYDVPSLISSIRVFEDGIVDVQ